MQPASTSSASHLSRVDAAAAAGPQNPRSSGGVASTRMRKAGRPPGAACKGVVASAPVFSAIEIDRLLSWSSRTKVVFSFSCRQASAAPSPRVTIAEQRRHPNLALSRRAWTSPLNAVPGKAANAVASGQLSLLASEAASSSTSVGVSLTGICSALGVSGDVGTSILLVWCAFGSLSCCVLLSTRPTISQLVQASCTIKRYEFKRCILLFACACEAHSGLKSTPAEES